MFKQLPSSGISSLNPTSKILLWSLTLVTLQACWTGYATAQIAPPASFEVNYTGALFGYYRIEPDRDPDVLPPVKAFRDGQAKQRSPVLLGMGDNFGPEFGASIERELQKEDTCFLAARTPTPGDRRRFDAPEMLYKDEDRLPFLAECDNVARFLMDAGYRAIAPGKEDFLDSATWLRRMALLLGGINNPKQLPNPFFPPDRKSMTSFLDKAEVNSPEHRLTMLAANLRVNFTLEAHDLKPGGPPPKGLSDQMKQKCPLFFSWDPLGEDATPCAPGGGADGNTVTSDTDWLRRLDLTLDRFRPDVKEEDSAVARSIVAQAKKDPTFRQQLLENQTLIALRVLDPTLLAKSCSSAAGEIATIRAAMQDFSQDKGYKASPDSSGQVRMADPKAADKLRKLPTMTCESDAVTLKVVEEMNLVVQDLAGRLELLDGKREQGAENFIESPQAREATAHLLLRKIGNEQLDIGYTLVTKESGQSNTLVIGVVGQETMSAVAPSNLELCTQYLALSDKATTEKDLTSCSTEDEGKDRKLESGYGRLVGKVVVGDPVLAVTTLVRAARERYGASGFGQVVVMAQMPHTEAEELAAHAHDSLVSTSGGKSDAPRIDLIVSEAQQQHVTRGVTLKFGSKDAIPVVTPRPAWEIDGTTLVKPISTAEVEPNPNSVQTVKDRILTNTVPDDPSREPGDAKPMFTMAQILEQLLEDPTVIQASRQDQDIKTLWKDCHNDDGHDDVACQNSVMMEFLLKEIHRSSKADVVLLENRDFYFGKLLPAYDDQTICPEWMAAHSAPARGLAHPKEYCRLHVALDRVLWKGDYSERVMVDGKSLKQMITTAQQETDEERTLAARDTTNEWLMTFGIVTQPAKNLSAASQGPETFTVPGESFCKLDTAQPGSAQYCIDGQKVSDDGAYWVATSDHLAQDKVVYKTLAALDTSYHTALSNKRLYVTGEIANEIFGRGVQDADDAVVHAADAQVGMSEIEKVQQMRPIVEIDFTKLVAGFMTRKPDETNAQLASNFSGVADSRATTPNAQEMDIEAATRMTLGLGFRSRLQPFTFGIQSDTQYDRAVAGNLTGAPETVTYALNSSTVGGFLQYHINNLQLPPRWLLVAAPYQYQRQITGNYLNFKYTTGTGQITVAAPRGSGINQRFGVRNEVASGHLLKLDAGSYWEIGPEYSTLNNVLSALVLPNGTVCPASEVAFSTCVAKNITVTPSTVITPRTETLHSGGAYWDVHLQKAFGKSKHTSATVETKGDDFLFPGVTLPTQARYAFTTSGAVNFAVYGNLTFSPTYTTFFYENQGTPKESGALLTNTFSITAKWYFARDASVPGSKQFRFVGPASQDQTKTAKMK